MRAALSRLRAFLGDRRGVSAIEFALTVPILILLVIGVAELGRYGMFRMKLSNAVANVGDLVARAEEARAGEIDAVIGTAPVLLAPFDESDRLRIMVSAVEQVDPDDPPQVAWQRTGGDLSSETSRVGAAGDDARVPDRLVSEEIATLIVCEIAFAYEAWLLGFVADHVAYDAAFIRPRRASLAQMR